MVTKVSLPYATCTTKRKRNSPVLPSKSASQPCREEGGVDKRQFPTGILVLFWLAYSRSLKRTKNTRAPNWYSCSTVYATYAGQHPGQQLYRGLQHVPPSMCTTLMADEIVRRIGGTVRTIARSTRRPFPPCPPFPNAKITVGLATIHTVHAYVQSTHDRYAGYNSIGIEQTERQWYFAEL